MRLFPEKTYFSFITICVAFFLLGILTNCQQEEQTTEPSNESQKMAGIGLPEGLPLRIRSEKVYLRSSAGFQSEVIAELTANQRVFEMGEVSAFLSQLQRGGKNYKAPWIKVQTLDGLEGWVFASADFLEMEEKEIPYFSEIQLQAELGKPAFEIYKAYQQSKDSISEATGFLSSFRALQQLQSTCQQNVNQAGQEESAFWLRNLIPELIIQRDQSGQSDEFYMDYRYWFSQAQQTADSTDDIFVDLYISMFPDDSIEYRFPVWFFQTSANDGHSLLGRGIHLEMFEKIEILNKLTPIYEQELMQIKNALVEDIIFLNTTYWEEKEKASAELRQILDRTFTFLTPADRSALEKRLQDFKKSEELGILFNFKSGIHQN